MEVSSDNEWSVGGWLLTVCVVRDMVEDGGGFELLTGDSVWYKSDGE